MTDTTYYGGIMNILIIDDEPSICELISDFIKENFSFNTFMAYSIDNAIKIYHDVNPFLIISDINLPEKSGIDLLKYVNNSKNAKYVDVVLMTGLPDINQTITSLREGVYDYFLKPIKLDELKAIINRSAEHQNLLRENLKFKENINSAIITEKESLEKRYSHLNDQIRNNLGIKNFRIFSNEMRKIYDLATSLHNNRNISVLINGETGTGKEMVAKFIHHGQVFDDSPFVAINCAAIPEQLFESELFGYEAGAFTGSNKKGSIGKIELAEGGTLFLDEIGEMPLSFQSKLLRFLQEREFYKVGGLKKIKSNIRLIAATNKDLQLLISNKQFREDLFYRLNIVNIKLKPLRERKDEIIHFCDFFISKFLEDSTKKEMIIADDAKNMLIDFPWKGNIRELRNVMERLVVLTDKTIINRKDLNFISNNSNIELVDLENFILPDDSLNLKDFEKQIILKTLEKFDGNKTHAAKYLCLTRSAFRSKLSTIAKNQ
jgi:DNA-binding NtrC family response regulator